MSDIPIIATPTLGAPVDALVALRAAMVAAELDLGARGRAAARERPS